MSNIKLLDCTFRDGGHLLNWKFKQKTVEQVMSIINNSGIDYFEIGYRFNKEMHKDKDFGDLAFSTDKYLTNLKEKTNIKNITIMMDVGKTKKDDFVKKSESPIDTVRVATYSQNIDLAIEHIEDLYEKGYEVFLNLMALTHISDKDFFEILKKIDLVKSKIQAFYFADSFGSMYPNSIIDIVKKIKNNTDIKIGFHGHNNLQMAFANAITAIDCGVEYIDSSLYGQGRGAGNLPTEIICAYLNTQNSKKIDMKKIIEVIDKIFLRCSDKVTWGYNIDTFLTGINDIHPTYIKTLNNLNISTVDNYSFLKKMSENKKVFSMYNEEALKELLKKVNYN